jgi:hypothetical protein
VKKGVDSAPAPDREHSQVDQKRTIEHNRLASMVGMIQAGARSRSRLEIELTGRR